MTETFVTTFATYPAIGWRTERIELITVPSLGGRLVSLRDLQTRREWFWHPPGEVKLWANNFGDSFQDSPHVGLDECLPTVGACVWKGRTVPDHGEIWMQNWQQVDEAAWLQGIFRSMLRLSLLPFEFERCVSVRDNEVQLAYRLTNFGEEAEEYLWSMHPLFTVENGDKLELPDGVENLRVDVASAAPIIEHGTHWDWPQPFADVHLDNMKLGGEGYVKAFAGPLNAKQNRAALINAGKGDRLEVRWNAQEQSFMGLWLTRGGWRGWHHVAIEPCSGAPDSLATAVEQWNCYKVLQPGETRHWIVQLRVGL